MAGYVSADNKKEVLSEGYVCLYSKKTSNGNTVYTGSFIDNDCGKSYYLRTTLKTVDSDKKQGSKVCIVNIKTYKASKNRGR